MVYRYGMFCFLLICFLFSAVGCGGGTIENDKPKFSFIEPSGDDDGADTTFVITWTDKDPDDAAEITLYYDTDNTGLDGTLIAGGISEDSSPDWYSWDTSGLGAGTYYIYARISDSVNDPVYRYSGSLTVSHSTIDNDAPSITVTEPDGTSDSATSLYTIRWTDEDPDDNASISLYYDTDNIGADGTLIIAGLSEDGPVDNYTWNTSTVTDGSYYIYAVIYDGVNSAVYDYSSGQVTVWDGDIEVGASDTQVNTDSSGMYTSTEQQIACVGDRVYVVWTDYRNGDGDPDIYFNYSDDGGETWGGADRRLNTNSAGSSSSLRPQICAEGDYVFVVWEDNRNGSHYDIYFSCSDDKGVSWLSTDKRVDTHSAGDADSRYPVICTSGGNVYIAWQDYRNSGWEIYFNYSYDNGDHFKSSDIRVDKDDAGDSRYPKITCTSSGAYITWQDTRYGSDPDTFFNFVK